MSLKDKTGPVGIRAITGSGTGNCAEGQGRRGIKNGTGKSGAGRGQCGWFNASELAKHSPMENEDILLRQLDDALRKEQDEITKRLNKLGKQHLLWPLVRSIIKRKKHT